MLDLRRIGRTCIASRAFVGWPGVRSRRAPRCELAACAARKRTKRHCAGHVAHEGAEPVEVTTHVSTAGAGFGLAASSGRGHRFFSELDGRRIDVELEEVVVFVSFTAQANYALRVDYCPETRVCRIVGVDPRNSSGGAGHFVA